MFKRLALAALVVASFSAQQSNASQQINGSIGFGASTVTLSSGSNLGNTTTLDINSFLGANSLQASPLGDYAGAGPGPIWQIGGVGGGAKFNIPTITLSNLVGITISSDAGYGAFTSVASSGSFVSAILSGRTANFLDIFLIGNFVPASTFAAGSSGFLPTLTSVRLSFNQSGGSVSAGITLNSPPVPPQTNGVPEPATFIAALFGVVPFVIARRRRLA